MDWLTDRRRALLYAGALLMDMGAFCGYMAIPLFLQDHLGRGLSTHGLLGLLQLVVYLVLCPAASRLARLRSRRQVLATAGPVLLVAGYGLLGSAGVVWQVMGLMWLNATGAALFWPQLEAEIGHGTSGRALSRRMGLFNLSWSIGSTLSPAFVGWLYKWHWGLPFVAAAGTGLVVGTLMAVYRALCRRAGERIDLPMPLERPIEAQRPIPAAMPPMLVAFIFLAWLGNFVAYADMAVARFLFQQLGRALSFSDPHIGMLMALVGVTRTAAFVVLQVTQRWVYRGRYLFACQAALVAGMVLLSVPAGGVAVAAVAMALLGAGSALAYTASIFYSVEGAHYGKASTGLHEAVLGGGGAFGMLLAGQVAPYLTRANPRSPFVACAALTAVCLALQMTIHRRYRRRAARARAGLATAPAR